MAKNSAASPGRPVAPGVDPATPERRPDAPEGDGVTKTQNPETLHQEPAPAAPDANPVIQNDQSPVLNKEDDPRPLTGNGSTVETEMVKVKTKEAIILMDPFSAKHIDQNGVEVPVTSFINDELAEGGRLERA